MDQNEDDKLWVIYEHSDFCARNPHNKGAMQRAKASVALIKKLTPKISASLLARFAALSKQDVEDLVQDTYIAMARNGDIKRTGTLVGYACTVAFRKALRELKKRGKHQQLLSEWPIREQSPQKNADYELVFKALNRLEVEDRAILDLYYFKDFSVPEIAEILHRSEACVESRKWRALKRLAKDWSINRKDATE